LALKFDYIDPAGTPAAASFPMSNLCLAQQTFGIYGYLAINDSRLENYGSAFLTSETIYSDPETELVFPMTFEDTFDDTYISSFSQFGVTTYTNGTIRGEADGYGTLVLPNGTFDEVIRVKIVDESVDSTDLGLGIVEKIISTSTSYFWYSSVHPGPLCIHEYSEGIQVAIVEGLPNDTIAIDPDTSFSFDPTATTSSVEFYQTDAFELIASPNPFSSNLDLTFTSERAGRLEFELRNNLGQVVIQRVIDSVIGQNSLNLDTGTLPAGAYVAILKSKDEGSVRRILKTE
jgi:hypothetical protein